MMLVSSTNARTSLSRSLSLCVCVCVCVCVCAHLTLWHLTLSAPCVDLILDYFMRSVLGLKVISPAHKQQLSKMLKLVKEQLKQTPVDGEQRVI
jgi:hypothetical protein